MGFRVKIGVPNTWMIRTQRVLKSVGALNNLIHTHLLMKKKSLSNLLSSQSPWLNHRNRFGYPSFTLKSPWRVWKNPQCHCFLPLKFEKGNPLSWMDSDHPQSIKVGISQAKSSTNRVFEHSSVRIVCIRVTRNNYYYSYYTNYSTMSWPIITTQFPFILYLPIVTILIHFKGIILFCMSN